MNLNGFVLGAQRLRKRHCICLESPIVLAVIITFCTSRTCACKYKRVQANYKVAEPDLLMRDVCLFSYNFSAGGSKVEKSLEERQQPEIIE